MEKVYEISTAEIAQNLSVLRKTVGDARIYAVLKGNAYGMGLAQFAAVLYQNELRHFALTALTDALALRAQLPDADILLLTPCTMPQDAADAIDASITLSVGSYENAKMISDIASEHKRDATVHIQMDTGMGRYGFLPQALSEIQAACACPHLIAEGIYTHLHSAFAPKEKSALAQFSVFEQVIEALQREGLSFPVRHICNSTAVFRFPQMHLTAVRVGSALIGRVPPICSVTGLCKVGKLYGQVLEVRQLPKGHNVGYAGLYRTRSEQKIATVNVGYADGIAIGKQNDTFRFIDILRYGFNDFKLLFHPTPLVCLINGERATSLGRIGMTNLVLNVDPLYDIHPGDRVEIPVNPIYLSPLICRRYVD